MKRLLFTTMFLFACIVVQAQIEDGSDAPDFTVTDLNGNTHTLSTYLAQGKTVIIDISATWCAPCWNYHQSGALDNLYYTVGQGGSGEVVVLFVEGDGNTPVQSLYGISDVNDTWGNWTEHDSYPVIDSAQLGSLYQITYFPTIFRICPDGKVNVIPQLNVQGLQENINENCGQLDPLLNNGKISIKDQKVCEGNAIAPKIILKNYGIQPITEATIELRQGTTVLATKDFSGTIDMLNDATIVFDDVVIDPGINYDAAITTVNTTVPVNAATATAHFDVVETLESSNNIQVKIHTNYYPGEISWSIRNSMGSYVAFGGPYQTGNEDNFEGGGPDADTIKIHNVVLPGTDTECYSVELYSSTGLGWIGGDTQHGIEILSGSGEVIFSEFVENFGSVVKFPSAFKTNGTLGTPELIADEFKIFPNPTTGILNFMTAETVAVSIMDMTGKIVYKAESVSNGGSINLNALQKGMYMVHIYTENSQKTEKVIIK